MLSSVRLGAFNRGCESEWSKVFMVLRFEIVSLWLTSRTFVPLLLVGIIGLAACAKDETISPPTSIPGLASTTAPESTPTLAPSPTPTVQEGDIVATGVPSGSSGSSGLLATGEVSQELILPRDSYDASRNVSELIKPHFLAMDSDGKAVDPEGKPDLILEMDGKVKLRLKQGDQTRYLDLLALESGLLGEHPVHKVFRLQGMGVPLDDGLAEKLEPDSFADNLFHSAAFQYLQDKETSGVVAEVFPDGTFLAIPFDLPSEWYGEQAATEANLLDIQPGTRITFKPSGTEAFQVELATGQSLDPVLGPALSLDDGGGAPPDDGFSEVKLQTPFPFLGATYDSIFVGSDGHITLGEGDGTSAGRTAARHTGGPPRLSVLLADLDPACGGSVHADVRPDRAVVTWDKVVHIERGAADGCDADTPSNTFQAVVHSDGTIEYNYGQLDIDFLSQTGGNREAVIGVAEGNTEGSVAGIDLTGDLLLEQETGTMFEEFRPPPSDGPKGELASPTHLHVNPRALSAGDSDLAKDYEEEILALPFDEQRYPASPLARKQCGVYQESLQHSAYVGLLSSVGYRFNSDQPGQDDSKSFGERLSQLLRGGAGEGVRYFGFDSSWVAGVATGLGVSWLGDCDTSSATRRYRLSGADADDYYVLVRRSLDPDKTQRHKVVKLDAAGGGHEIYTAPGVMLMAMPLPWDDTRWMISSEGWPGPEEGKPADPRWQSVFIADINNPAQFDEVEYPISQFPEAPEEGLYGLSPSLNSSGNSLFNSLYGFTDEGGGLWAVDLTDKEFYKNPERFARIVDWDHLLSWVVLEEDTEGPTPNKAIFATGKEVRDDFAMTANFLRVNDAGIDSTLESKGRLLRMVGWNPVPFAWQDLSGHKFMVAVETHFNYESSLLPRAKGVYIIPVDTSPKK